MRKCPKLCVEINCCNVNFGAQFAKFPHGLLNIITGSSKRLSKWRGLATNVGDTLRYKLRDMIFCEKMRRHSLHVQHLQELIIGILSLFHFTSSFFSCKLRMLVLIIYITTFNLYQP